MERETTRMSIAGRMTLGMAPARIAGLLLVLVLGSSAVLPVAASAAGSVTIEIGGYSFAPAEVTVAPGTKVVWVNHDEMVHSVVSAEHLFGSAGMDTDDEYSFVFEKEGDYAYLCSLHPYMTGVVKVRGP